MDTSGFDEATLQEAETRFQRALLANDVAALDRFLHDDVRFTGPDGVTIDKATDMASHRSQAFTLSAVEEIDREVQIVAGVGVTRTTLRLVGTAGEQELDVVLAYTRAWVPSEEGWIVVAAHGGEGKTTQPARVSAANASS